MTTANISDDSDEQFDLWQKCRESDTEELFGFLYDNNYKIRKAAAMELQIRGERKTFEKALGLCESSDKTLREIGAFILGQLGTPDFPFAKGSVPILLSLFRHDSSPDVRGSAAAALGHLGDPAAIPVLSEGINDPEPQVRLDIAGALGSFGSPEIVRPLLSLSVDADKEVRNWAVFGLRMLNYEKIRFDSSELRERLLKMTEDSYEDVRREAICALAQLRDKRVSDILREELNKDYVSYEMIEAAGNLQDIRLLGLLEELREEWKEDSHDELIEAIKKLEGIKK